MLISISQMGDYGTVLKRTLVSCYTYKNNSKFSPNGWPQPSPTIRHMYLHTHVCVQ